MGDKIAAFDLDNPKLPKEIDKDAFQSGNFPYEKKLDRDTYEETLLALQIELVKLQTHLQTTDGRVSMLFEGRDAAGKGGSIRRYLNYLNPRHNRTIALSKPTEREQGQWYFQRYAKHLPTAGEQILYDRSWYNRAVVEPVMGFCTAEQTERFLSEAPHFERMIVDEGIHFFKFWLNIGQEMQLKRFHDRRHNPLKQWKLSPVDHKALGMWDQYTTARNQMLIRTDTEHAPWTIIRSNDKRRARIAIIQKVLSAIEYKGRDDKLVLETDPEIMQTASTFLKHHRADE
ncbi:polyphosphate kinase 2 [Maritalea sp.]|uniref:polyphosphate kinase 2 n=1 Tax=Maritalea sp. TaxID=2003361 RepID=UPI003EF46412